jgi:hypothetical protein
MPNCVCGMVTGSFEAIMTNKYIPFFVEDILLCFKYNDKIKLCMYSVYQNNIFIILIHPFLLLVTSKIL